MLCLALAVLLAAAQSEPKIVHTPLERSARGAPVEVEAVITDAAGVEHQLRSKSDLDAFLATLTPEEVETWKVLYRFAPVHNRTGIKDYAGTIRDML